MIVSKEECIEKLFEEERWTHMYSFRGKMKKKIFSIFIIEGGNKMTMMKAVNTIRIKKGKADEILPRFATPKSVHTFEGFVFMEVLKKENSPEYDELQVCTTWEDHTFFEKWRESRYAQKAHAKKEEQKPEESPILSAELTTFEVAVQHKPAGQEA
ncbi:antibiotic biosynthesis monooxygenase [Bacillus sp. B190/17]|uniref:Antibiotic biosynthesis monooxygenase n=1 Tax=Bacillus lumedeiriae TaxID=3058829 RepID=A0ABW8IEK2_9BACI